MPILDLNGAAPLFPKPEAPVRKRLMSPQNTAAILAGNGGAGAGGFAAAKINRLTMDFLAQSRSADQDLFSDNIRLRARARKLALDNFAARKFLQMLQQNVIGANGILLQAKVTGVNGKETAQTDRINERIEESWNNWCQACTADGKFSWVALQQMAIKNCGREGENLVKDVYGRQLNEIGYALQPLDNDQLDDTMMQTTTDNGEIRMGVEVDQYRRPRAYWLWNGHPNDILPGGRIRTRVPAEQITHTAMWERPAQTRGYTWMAAAILAMNQYGRYEEAVIVAARASAAKFLVVQQQLAEGYTGEDEDIEGEDTNLDGTQVMTANAGEALRLDPGETANFIDPRFPTNTHKDFTQTMLRNVASGLLVSYPMLANDLEGVNFSSIRAGLVDERDCWRMIQRWFIDTFCWPIFRKWLKFALLTELSDITLTVQQQRQFNWKARGYEWVDPLKDADAAVLKLGNMLTTYTDELSKVGLDFEEVAKQRASEQKYLDKLGLKMGTDITGDQAGKGVAAEAEGDVQGDEKAAGGGGQGGQQQGGGKGK